MLIRSLTLATMMAITGPLLAAENLGPLPQDAGKSRPLIVITRDSSDPVLVNLKNDLEVPANKQGFDERKLVLYTVIGLTGQRDGKNLEQPETMALIRSLKMGVGTKVILVGKDGEKKLEQPGVVDLKALFSTIDALPQSEKDFAPPAPPEPAAPAGKPGKHAKPAAASKPLDD